MKLCLIGYYGFRNLGDDLMLNNLIQYFLKKSSIKKIYVFVRENYYEQTYSRIQYLPLNRFSKLAKTIAIFRSDLVIWGGGTCIYDNKGLFDILKIQKISKFLGKKFIFLGIGIGKINNAKETACKILKNADYIYFRDNNSFQKANELIKIKNSCVGSDLVFLDTNIEKKFQSSSSIKNISFSGVYNTDKKWVKFYALQLEKLIENFSCIIHFLPAHTGDKNDNIFHKEIIKVIKSDKIKLHNLRKPQEFINTLSTMDFHIGMRLHSIIFADLFGIPNIGIEYAPKVRYYIKKTEILSEKRIFNIGDELNPADIITVHSLYRHPKNFIFNEQNEAKKCLEKFWNYYATK